MHSLATQAMVTVYALFIAIIVLTITMQLGYLIHKYYVASVATLAGTFAVGLTLGAHRLLSTAYGTDSLAVLLVLALVITSPKDVRMAQEKPKPTYKIPHTALDPAGIPRVPFAALQSEQARNLRFHSGINVTSAGLFIALCEDLRPQPRQTVYIHLNSCGGDTQYVDILRAYILDLARQHDVFIVANGLCASDAMSLFTALPVERRIAFPNTEFMIHAHTAYETVGSNTSKVEHTSLSTRWLQSLKNSDRVLAERLVAACHGITPEAIAQIFERQLDYVFYPTEAFALGVIGKLIEP